MPKVSISTFSWRELKRSKKLSCMLLGMVPTSSFSFLFCSLIVGFFAVVYLTVSHLGKTTSIDPDGSQHIIQFCDMDVSK
jgi:hypothetical protein